MSENYANTGIRTYPPVDMLLTEDYLDKVLTVDNIFPSDLVPKLVAFVPVQTRQNMLENSDSLVQG